MVKSRRRLLKEWQLGSVPWSQPLSKGNFKKNITESSNFVKFDDHRVIKKPAAHTKMDFYLIDQPGFFIGFLY